MKTILFLLLAAPLLAEGPRFLPAGECSLCHSRLARPPQYPVLGQYALWEQSMMAHSAVDPYWRARVQLEVKASGPEVEDLCLRCHAPAQQFPLRARSRKLTVAGLDDLGRDGVTCTVCHQITPEGLGTASSFTGGFLILPLEKIFGPHKDPFQMPMQHHTGFTPAESRHVLESSLCATCHTVVIDHGSSTLVEQGAYLEWLASSYPAAGRTCQSCHMPALQDAEYIAHRPPGGPFPPTSPRSPFARHEFAGANAVLPDHLGHPGAAARARRQLESALRLGLNLSRQGGALISVVEVRNLAGHKLPTGFPSRRLWLRFTVTDASGKTVFESGASDPGRQPHHKLITQPGQAQVFESESADASGALTMSLLKAVRHSKDNRILPAGFRPMQFQDLDIHPQGVEGDAGFQPGLAKTAYSIPLPAGPVRVRVQAVFQVINPLHLPPGNDPLKPFTREMVIAEAAATWPAASGR